MISVRGIFCLLLLNHQTSVLPILDATFSVLCQNYYFKCFVKHPSTFINISSSVSPFKSAEVMSNYQINMPKSFAVAVNILMELNRSKGAEF